MTESIGFVVPVKWRTKEHPGGADGGKDWPRGICEAKACTGHRPRMSRRSGYGAATPKEKLTALLHHITTDALGVAYFSLEGPAAGVTG